MVDVRIILKIKLNWIKLALTLDKSRGLFFGRDEFWKEFLITYIKAVQLAANGPFSPPITRVCAAW
jgi:hypothetical protein